MLRASDNIYFAPAIPYKKLQGAMSYLPQGIHPDEILMLIDDTVFGSAKAGLCVTATGLFYKESFGDEVTYLFKNIHHVEAEIGVINHGIVLNRMETLTFTQLDKGIVRTLAEFLNEVCQSQASQLGQQIPNAKPFIHLYTYFMLGYRGEWHDKAREVMATIFDRDIFKATDKQYLIHFMQSNQRQDLYEIVDELKSISLELPLQIRMMCLDDAMGIIVLRHFPDTNWVLEFAPVCQALNVSEQMAESLINKYEQYFSYTVNTKQSKPKLTVEQQHACEILDIQPESLTEQSLQSAYRKKMAEFHPDKYQNLPESVRQLIESQAQQLNQARAILKRYLDNN
ncbi:DnaJ family molecular chaperone [Acinetobacter sp. V91_13]|uniref:J domain-containing protein n=1 Tax=unclassified Acinetobacter TaxID=196816 RepID=UPI0038F7BC60